MEALCAAEAGMLKPTCQRFYRRATFLGVSGMTLPHRRQILRFAAGATALPALSQRATAQAYPARPVRWIVGFAPGGTQDILARLMGQWLSDRLGQSFVVENRTGASGNIGAEAVVRAPPDGYTLLLIGPANAINATLYENLNFDFLRDIAPVAGIIRVPNVMVVHPSFPADTVSEFIAYAKANPGEINMASGGNGSSQHVAGELFKMMTGVNMAHVPYRGGAPALIDLIGGQVQVMFGPMPEVIEYLRVGKLRPLAVTSATRSEALPDIPTVAEFVPGYEASALLGVGVPRNSPAEVIETLNTEINAALSDRRIRRRLTDLGGTVLPGSPADFSRLIAEEIKKWGKVIKFANIKLG
jgi:tripartite-type tricarboxylate transporter receptor subunit TctC